MFTPSKPLFRGSGITPAPPLALHGCAATRTLERQYPDDQTDPPLMQRAGLAIARLALALAPYSKSVWVACGPGNNGADGLLAAQHLQQWGKCVVVTGPASIAQAASERGLGWSANVPGSCDLAIDALLGIGAVRAIDGRYADWVVHIEKCRQLGALVLAVDVPSGLHADKGTAMGPRVTADHTLSLLTLKPGLFTGEGRDVCGQIWFNPLDVESVDQPPDAWLSGSPLLHPRQHSSHKGSYGDVAVVGGATGMAGAAVLAATAALHAGAGRVYVSLLGADAMPAMAPAALMTRPLPALHLPDLSVVAGCGAGPQLSGQMATALPRILAEARHVVLDADALNIVSQRPDLQATLARRNPCHTVLTPHPLEAARLLNCDVATIQADRFAAAQALAARFHACVVLKGAGSIISAPGYAPRINPTGNARLACAGTGDVLAGTIGALLAGGQAAPEAACDACYRHGQIADDWPAHQGTLTADALAHAMAPNAAYPPFS